MLYYLLPMALALFRGISGRIFCLVFKVFLIWWKLNVSCAIEKDFASDDFRMCLFGEGSFFKEYLPGYIRFLLERRKDKKVIVAYISTQRDQIALSGALGFSSASLYIKWVLSQHSQHFLSTVSGKLVSTRSNACVRSVSGIRDIRINIFDLVVVCPLRGCI